MPIETCNRCSKTLMNDIYFKICGDCKKCYCNYCGEKMSKYVDESSVKCIYILNKCFSCFTLSGSDEEDYYPKFNDTNILTSIDDNVSNNLISNDDTLLSNETDNLLLDQDIYKDILISDYSLLPNIDSDSDNLSTISEKLINNLNNDISLKRTQNILNNRNLIQKTNDEFKREYDSNQIFTEEFNKEFNEEFNKEFNEEFNKEFNENNLDSSIEESEITTDEFSSDMSSDDSSNDSNDDSDSIDYVSSDYVSGSDEYGSDESIDKNSILNNESGEDEIPDVEKFRNALYKRYNKNKLEEYSEQEENITEPIYEKNMESMIKKNKIETVEKEDNIVDDTQILEYVLNRIKKTRKNIIKDILEEDTI